MSSSILTSGRINLENFTDRILPRREFWKHYRELEAALTPDVPSRVLMYHGIGGIGKTTLLAKLKQELEEDRKNNKQPAPVYAEYSFQSPDRDSRTVLRQLCTDLQRRGNFVFPHFAYGLYHYATKRGEPADSPDVKGLFDQIPILNDVFEALDMVPGVGIIPKMIKTADTDIAKLRSWLKGRKNDFKQIEDLDTDTLYAELPRLFSEDMQLNINKMLSSKKKAYPVVIFLDTYEELVNDQRTSVESDTWIRGELGLVRNIPGVLWVIAGRNALKWQAFDPFWTPQPPHFLLGTLSDEDSAAYLGKEGVLDTELQGQLYKLTNGTPLFLDICVRQYRALIRQKKIPHISMFGQSPEELIYRFVRNMSDTQKDIVYMLSALQNWTEALLNDLAPIILRSYSDSAYYSVLEQSFIQYTEDMHYHIHKTMGEVLQNTAPGKVIGKRTGKALLEHFAPGLKDTSMFSPAFFQALMYTTRGALLYHADREAFRTYFEQELLSVFLEPLEVGYSQQMLTALDMVESYASQRKDDLMYALWMRIDAVCARKQNNAADALSSSDTSLRLYRALLKENDPELLAAMHHRAVALNFAGDYPAALSIAEETLEKRRSFLGREALDTLLTKSLVALIKNNLGQSEEALAIQKETLEQLHRTQSDKHSVITGIQSNMAETYDKLGLHEEAFVVRQDVWKKQSEAYGEDDPRTLLSMDNLADTAARLGKHDAAIVIKELVVEKYRSTRGEDDPETINAIQDLEAMRNEAILHPEFTDIKQSDESYADAQTGGNMTPDTKPHLTGDDNAESVSAVPKMDTHAAIDKISSSFGISAEKRNAIISGDAAKFRSSETDTAATPKEIPETEPAEHNEAPAATPQDAPASTSSKSSPKKLSADMLASLSALMASKAPAEKKAEPAPAPETEAPAEPAPAEEQPKKQPADMLASLAALMASKTPEKKAESAPPEGETPPETPAEPAPVEEQPKKQPADMLASLAALMASKAPEKKAESAPAPEGETPPETPAEPAPVEEQPKKQPADMLASLAALMASKAPEKKPESAPAPEAETPPETPAEPAPEPEKAPEPAEKKKPGASPVDLDALSSLIASKGAKKSAEKKESSPVEVTPAPEKKPEPAPAPEKKPEPAPAPKDAAAKALAVLKNVLDYRMRILGEQNPDTWKAMAELAKGYTDAGAHADARKLLEQLLKLQKAALGDTHKDTISTMQLLEACLTALGDTHGAMALRMQLQMLLKSTGEGTT